MKMMGSKDLRNGASPESQFGAGLADDDSSVTGLLQVFHRRRKGIFLWWILLTIVTMLIIATRHPRYEANTLLIVAAQSPSANSSSSSSNILSPLQALTQSRNTDTQLEVLQSPELIRQAYTSLGTKNIDRAFHPTERDKAMQLPPKWVYQVDNKEDTDAVELTVRAYDPVIGAKFANAVAETYLKRDLEQNNHSTKDARVFVGRELRRAKEQFTDASRKFEILKNKTGLIAADTQVMAEATRLYAIKTALDVNGGLVAASAKRLAQLQQMMQGQVRSLPSDTSSVQVNFAKTVQENPNFITEVGRYNDLLAQKSQTLNQFKPDSIEMVRLEQRITDERQLLAKTAQNVLGASTVQTNPVRQAILELLAAEVANHSALDAQVKAGNASLAQSNAVLNTFPRLQRQLAETALDVQVFSSNYQTLYSQYLTLQVEEKSNVPNGYITSHAIPAPFSYFPSPLIYLLGIFGCLVLAFLAAVAAEWADTRIHDPAMAEAIIGSTMLALIPQIGTSKSTNTSARSASWILLEEGPDGINQGMLEAYRTLRNNLYFAAPDSKTHLLAITSASPGEGKTTTVVNLAIALGMDGKRVLVVDGDLRRPSIAKVFGVPREVGVTNVIAGQAELKDAVLVTRFDNVWALPSGPLPPNPTELLNSEKSRLLLRSLTDSYDYVLVDSPPTAGISDVQVISHIVDAVLFVVALDRASRPALQIAARTFSQADTRLVGLVLNFVKRDRPGYYGYYAYYNEYYNSYDAEGAPMKVQKKSLRKRVRKGRTL